MEQDKKHAEVESQSAGSSSCQESQEIRLSEGDERWPSTPESPQTENDLSYTLDEWWANRGAENQQQTRRTRAKTYLFQSGKKVVSALDSKKDLLTKYADMTLTTLRTYRDDPHQARKHLNELRRRFQESIKRYR